MRRPASENCCADIQVCVTPCAMRVNMLIFLTCFGLAGCNGSPAPQPDLQPGDAPVISLGEIGTTADGRCLTRMDPTTETQIVTELVEVQPAVKDENGVVITPAIFRNVTGPKTVPVAEGAQFETVCPQVYTPEFVATLQRALIVRRAYDGEVTGLMDAPTSLALQQFQRGSGINSPLLSMRVARELGIVAVPR